MRGEALAVAHHVGVVMAACAEGALLAAHPQRYAEFAEHVGRERARVQLVDWLSRAGRCLRNVDDGNWDASAGLTDLELPLRGFLLQVVDWEGTLPVPTTVCAAAEALIPLLGVARRDPDGFEPYEAPTIPTAKRSTNALESLEDELVDERTEVRLLLEELIASAGLASALVCDRTGEVIAQTGGEPLDLRAGRDSNPETSALVASWLETSDLFFSLRVGDTVAAVRLAGAHAMLVATGPSQQSLMPLREPTLGYTLGSLLESFRYRLDRLSSPPTLMPEDEPPRSAP